MKTKKKPKMKNKIPKRELTLILRNKGLEEQIKELEVAIKLLQEGFDRRNQVTENRIYNLRMYTESLEQENHNLMEAIKGLGEVLGESKSEIQRLKQTNEIEHNYITPKNTISYDNNQKQENIL